MAEKTVLTAPRRPAQIGLDRSSGHQRWPGMSRCEGNEAFRRAAAPVPAGSRSSHGFAVSLFGQRARVPRTSPFSAHARTRTGEEDLTTKHAAEESSPDRFFVLAGRRSLTRRKLRIRSAERAVFCACGSRVVCRALPEATGRSRRQERARARIESRGQAPGCCRARNRRPRSQRSCRSPVSLGCPASCRQGSTGRPGCQQD